MIQSFMTKKKLLNKRQDRILDILNTSGRAVAVSDIFVAMGEDLGKVARITIIRDLKQLLDLQLVARTGSGRGVVYTLSPAYNLIKPIDVDAYFKIDSDKREINKRFNFDIFSVIKNGIFSASELNVLQKNNTLYRANVKKMTPQMLKREFERLTIDLSWKSSKIEGNTYTLLETEYLLKEHQEPKGHTKEETTMILNHKKTLDYAREYKSQFKKLSVSKIEDVHALLIKDLGVERNIRRRIVRVAGTAYTPLDNQFQIKEALEKMCHLVNATKNPFDKAIIAMLCIAYIQPFEDGNKRTSRLIGNALLMTYDCCPLSFRSIDELEYKKAILLFYEQNNLSYFKKLFIDQFDFAVKNYFG